ncbi:hypothetical protein BC938DRAFT_478238 [Jimgerdemannia flammicorona]|uniref:Tyrosine--tRNA ligase n=1 Tax=Jimgerdemannia flammicorona TaxID=994334 RepID=A0A433QN62_9FUNG|nr:hypothetical protein BC938DRAFT_478238 [Jimgerdemannia flammicorona]
MIHRKRPNSPLILEEEGNGDVRAEGNPAFGITIPLLTTSTGEKFGKSAGNAVWLDERLTSVYEFYQVGRRVVVVFVLDFGVQGLDLMIFMWLQFFMKTTDADVGKYLLMFTLLPIPEIEEIVHEHMKNPDRHLAQHKLADEATELVHGPTGLRHARVATDVLFGGSLQDVSGRDLAAAFEHDSSRLVRLAKDQVVGQGLDAVAVLCGWGRFLVLTCPILISFSLSPLKIQSRGPEARQIRRPVSQQPARLGHAPKDWRAGFVGRDGVCVQDGKE